ncbi:monovalent cation:H+ antiporter, CPA1 (nhx1) [Coemansia sp. RSA 2618]|nr:monovalent cation:H+ antiporter, CPA1 (nhx1) [Coemansia sp. RSA 2618]
METPGITALVSTATATLANSGVTALANSAVTTLLLLSSTATAQPSPSEGEEPPPEDEERVSSQALLILVTLLIAALLTSYYLQRWRIRTVHETVLSIFAGMAVGLVLRFSTGSYIKRMVTFDHTVFFNMLLPPIILNCGYNLQKTSVARNIPAVLTFAFGGTVISAAVIGVLVQAYSLTGIERIGFSLLDSLILGTILSATDPVTILAVFEQLRVDPKLFSIIFGETVFNDAVAIVLFATLSALRASGAELTLRAVPAVLWAFVRVFGASLAVGVLVGVFMALLCKHLRLHAYASIEASLALLLPYQAYLFSNAVGLSGIVSLLFSAATMRQYAYRSLSAKSRRTTRYLFHLLSGLAENFVFIYLGISLFTAPDMRFRPVFIVFVAIATCVSRYAAIFPLSRVLNAVFKYRHPSAPSSAQPVTHEEQTMLFWAGLRGAVAVALAGEVSGENGALLRTTVLCVVVLSVGVFGGTTPQVVHLLGIRTGVPQPDSSDEDASGSDDDEEEDVDDCGRRTVINLSLAHNDPRAASVAAEDRIPMDDIPSTPSPPPLSRLSSPWSEPGVSWVSRIRGSFRSLDRSLIYDFDKHYVRPLLTRQDAGHSTSHRRIRRRRSHGNGTRMDRGRGAGSPRVAVAGSGIGTSAGADASPWSDHYPSQYPDQYPDQYPERTWASSSSSDTGSPSKSRSDQPLLGN